MENFFILQEDQSVTLQPALAKFRPKTPLSKSHSSPEILDLLLKIFVWDPAKRITADQALRLPLFLKK
jgi:serine/threonine protein kinase